jgi:N4-gp56 family major capsid protein
MLTHKILFSAHSLNSANTNVTDPTGTSYLGNAMIERFMVKRLLRLIDKDTIFYKLGHKESIPKGESKTITFTRWERIRPPRTSLTEGVTPTGTRLTVSRVSAVCEQWGSFCTISDVAELTVRNEPFQRAVELVGMQAAETLDREIQRVLIAGTNVYYPNGKTSRATITTADVLDTPLLRKIRAQLKHNKAPGVGGGDKRKKFIGVCDSFMAADLMADTTFIESAKFQNLEPLTSGEFGEWQGIRWQESNHIPALRRTVSASASTTSFAIDNATVSGSTDLDDGAYKIAITGYDAQGFETLFSLETFGDTGSTPAMGGTTSTDIIQIVLPAISENTDSGVETAGTFVGDTELASYNIYCTAVGGSTYYLQGENLAAGTYHIVKAYTGSDTTVLVLNATGRQPPDQPAVGVNVHQAYIFGNEWFSVAEIEGVKVMLTPSGAQKGDELAQRRSVGWKFFCKALITNQNFGCRIEAASLQD